MGFIKIISNTPNWLKLISGVDKSYLKSKTVVRDYLKKVIIEIIKMRLTLMHYSNIILPLP